MLAEEVVVVRRRQSGVRVRRADHAELVGVGAELGFDLEAELEPAASVLVDQHVVGLELAQIEIALVPGTEVGELVIGREHRMGFAVALDLRRLVERLPPGARLDVLPSDRLVVDVIDQGEHEAVREVAVVGDGEDVTAGLVLIGLKKLPEVLRVGTTLRCVGRRGNRLQSPVRIVPVDDHPVQVLTGGNLGGPLVAYEGREVARIVVFLGRRDGLLPGVSVGLRVRPVHHRLGEGPRAKRYR